jgi:16S rRNA (cytosine1402-N4)-methyltransferase
MDKTSSLTAQEIINTYDEKELTKIFFEYGEERHSRRIARAICTKREAAPIETTLALAEIIENAQPKTRGKITLHPATRSFMALRIAVNNELLPLGAVLASAVEFLRKGGRIAVITFHSLEDRITKTTFARLANPCDCPRDIPYCVCGKTPSLRVITKKSITATPQELSENSRASCAKLRAAEHI